MNLSRFSIEWGHWMWFSRIGASDKWQMINDRDDWQAGFLSCDPIRIVKTMGGTQSTDSPHKEKSPTDFTIHDPSSTAEKTGMAAFMPVLWYQHFRLWAPGNSPSPHHFTFTLPYLLLYLLVFLLSFVLHLFCCFSIPSHSTRIIPLH